MNLFNGTIQSLEKSLDFATAKERAISNNISNVDTPNYKAKTIDFKNILENELAAKRTNPKHVSFNENSTQNFPTKTRNNTTYNNNGNNVDIDREMTSLAKNQIYYQGLIDRVNGKFGDIQTVIRGGS